MTDRKTQHETEGADQSSPARLMVFLKLGGIMVLFAVMTYVLLGSNNILDDGGIGSVFYMGLNFVLLIFVVLALFFMMCFTSPRIGAAVMRRGQYIRDAWGTPMKFLGMGGLDDGSLSAEKRQATRRKSHRANRRRLARETQRPGNGDQTVS